MRGAGGAMAPRVSHEPTCVGGEPTLEAYFFERVRPIVEAALSRGPSADWPLITLNLDFKTNEPEHHAAVWALLGKYERWLTTAPRGADAAVVAPLQVGPVLVLTGSPDIQQVTFHDVRVPCAPAARLWRHCRHRARPSRRRRHCPARRRPPTIAAGGTIRGARSRWKDSATAGDWTPDDAARLAALVADAHAHGLWIRFYTLNGVAGRARGLDAPATTSAASRPPHAAGAPPSTRRSTSSPRISTRSLHDASVRLIANSATQSRWLISQLRNRQSSICNRQLTVPDNRLFPIGPGRDDGGGHAGHFFEAAHVGLRGFRESIVGLRAAGGLGPAGHLLVDRLAARRAASGRPESPGGRGRRSDSRCRG